jgi:hypothetical protein
LSVHKGKRVAPGEVGSGLETEDLTGAMTAALSPPRKPEQMPACHHEAHRIPNQFRDVKGDVTVRAVSPLDFDRGLK